MCILRRRNLCNSRPYHVAGWPSWAGPIRQAHYNKKYSLQRPKFIEEAQSEEQEENLADIVPRRIFDNGFFNPENIIKQNLMNTQKKNICNISPPHPPVKS